MLHLFKVPLIYMQTQVLFSTEIFGIRTILKNKTIQLRLPNILKIKKKKKKCSQFC